ncbi:hypothetical protein DSC45_16990 [Streptomyces sp. YIM 130001]|uniref:hypothetical protein n=1 Tax=Streptomyces sp. YIM 130001 TaxID=2259644 RepID=UPI000E655CB4|nr:hypothetical protein [Streptomyces sp. YIM 130001]RII15939.1 hypothetical protein DSC45_16990 [Streptomyces sp. YIM 130001]
MLSPDEHDNPWQWQDGHNPYLRTPLQILGLAAGTPGRSAVRSAARRRRLRAERGGDRFPLFGRPVEAVEVNTAEQELITPTGRLLAELRTHRPPAASREADLAHRLTELTAEFEHIGRTAEAGADGAEVPGTGRATEPGGGASTAPAAEACVLARPEALLGWLPVRPAPAARRTGESR